MTDTASHARDIAEGMGLGLTDQELENAVAIVESTGSFAPESVVVEVFKHGMLPLPPE